MVDVRDEPEVYEYNADGDDSEEFVATGNVDVVTSRYRTLATRALDSGEGLQFGRGSSERPDKAEGFADIEMVDDTNGNVQHGKYRLTLRTKSGQLVGIITSLDSSKTNIDRTDLPDGQPLPVQDVNGDRFAGGGAKGYEVHLEMRASNTNGSFTWDYDNSSNTVDIDGHRVFQ